MFRLTWTRNLRMGTRGEDVRAVQQLLMQAGFDPGPIDGIFGGRTQAATKAFQSARGLMVDGVVGPITFGALTTPASPAGQLGVDHYTSDSTSTTPRTACLCQRCVAAATRGMLSGPAQGFNTDVVEPGRRRRTVSAISEAAAINRATSSSSPPDTAARDDRWRRARQPGRNPYSTTANPRR
jgi:peptidoglycan hydrolase-like protein with peptidoglycan-binding domain